MGSLIRKRPRFKSPQHRSYLPGSGRASLRCVFTDLPAEIREADPADNHIGQLRGEENSQPRAEGVLPGGWSIVAGKRSSTTVSAGLDDGEIGKVVS